MDKNKKDIKVSFVIPALNVEKTITKCLKSIFDQDTNEKFEVILLDNGSQDKTIELASQFGIRIFKEPGKSVAALRNLGAKFSRGEIIAYVDADCMIARNWLEKALRYFNNFKIGAVGSPTRVPDNATWVQKAWYVQRKGSDKVEEVEWLPTENLLVRKEAFLEVGGFNEDLVTCEDVDFCYRLSKRYKIISDPDIISIHLGEAKNIAHFFRKELWRGKGNIKGLFSHGFKVSELPSILYPVYYLFFLLFFLIAIGIFVLKQNYYPLVFSIFMLVIPPIILAFRVCIKKKEFKWIFALTILFFVYGVARALALLFWKENK